MWYSLALNFFGESKFRILLRSFTICVSSLCLSLRLLGGDDWIKGVQRLRRVLGYPQLASQQPLTLATAKAMLGHGLIWRYWMF